MAPYDHFKPLELAAQGEIGVAARKILLRCRRQLMESALNGSHLYIIGCRGVKSSTLLSP
jgi:hypothetical protein